jgi:CRP-like cAMP-binding protein
LSYQQLVRIMNVARQRPTLEGEKIFAEGDVGDQLYVILSGRVSLTKRGVEIASFGPGAHLGEMALIDSSTRSATATIGEPGKLLSITRHDFLEILRKEPQLAVKLLWSFVRVLAERLRTTTAELTDVRQHQVPDMTEELAEDLFES